MKPLMVLSLLILIGCSRAVHVEINYPGKWEGVVLRDNVTESVYGTGYTKIELGQVDTAGATIQKNVPDDYSIMTVKIENRNNNLFTPNGIDEVGSTSDVYGIVSLIHEY